MLGSAVQLVWESLQCAVLGYILELRRHQIRLQCRNSKMSVHTPVKGHLTYLSNIAMLCCNCQMQGRKKPRGSGPWERLMHWPYMFSLVEQRVGCSRHVSGG